MRVLHDRLMVRFDEKHNKVIPLGNTGIELLRPDEWVHRDGDEETCTTTEENCNYLETKPQIGIVTHANDNYPYRVGDKVFMHYMAYESGEYANEETKEAFVDANTVFFTFMPDGSYKMAENTYFGIRVLTEDEKTESGIIINAFGLRPIACQIKLTHAPDGGKYKVGQTIITIDNHQYPSNIEGKEYIMVRDREIVGVA